MVVTCSQCGYENDPQHHFCGMCGEPLRAPYAAPTPPNQPVPDIIGRAAGGSRPILGISGPSVLGLGSEEPSRSVDYLLEEQDEPRSGGHGVVYLVLLFMVAAAAVGAWHWREGYPWEARGPQPQPASSVAPAVSPTPDANSANSAPASPDANSSAATAAPATSPAAPAPDATTPAAGTSEAQPAAKPAAGDSASPNSDQTPDHPKAAEPKAAAPVAESKPKPAKPVVAHKAAPKRAAAADDSDDASNDADDDSQTADAVPPRNTSRPSPRDVALATPADPTDAWVSDGQRYLYGNGVPQNCARAKAQMLAAAGRSNAQAQSTLGTMYATGHCVDRDVVSAYRWFAQALHNDRTNTRIEQDLRVLWSQMTPQEKQAAQQRSSR